MELFRDGVYLTNLIITDTAASVKIGTSGSYNARIYKVVDGLTYLLVETPVVVVGTISSAFIVEPVARLVATGGNWNNDFDYLYFETTPDGRFIYGIVSTGTTTRHNGDDEYDFKYDPSDGMFYDFGNKAPINWGQDNTGTNSSEFPTNANRPTHYWYSLNNDLRFQFDNPYYVAPPDPVARLVATGGGWEGTYDYLCFETTSDGRYLYDLVPQGTDTKYQPGDAFAFEYDPSDGKSYDVGSEIPYIWGIDDIGTNLSAFPTSSNMEKHYFYHSNGDLRFQFENPYYVAPVTELIFDGINTINLVNIPEDATKVELFRDGISLGPLLIDGTAASVTIGTSRSYNARIYKVVDGLSYLLIETPVLSTVPVVKPLTKESNIALRATFKDSTVYIHPDTNVSGSLSIDENSFNVNTVEYIQGKSSGYKADTTDAFRLDNFIADPYTITFWMLSKYTGTWGGDWQAIISLGRYPDDSWRMYFYHNTGEIGVYSGGWNGSGITYDQIYNKWVLISISSSGICTIKSDGVNYDNSLMNFTGFNTSGDTMEFSGTADDTRNHLESTNIYFDDIRVYNVELSSSDMIDVYNENYVAPVALEPVEILVLTFNHYPDSDYAYMETTPAGRFLYGLVDEDTTDRREGDDRWDFEYDPVITGFTTLVLVSLVIGLLMLMEQISQIFLLRPICKLCISMIMVLTT